MSRRLLQITNAFLALATIVLAGMSLFLGADSPVYGSAPLPEIPALDSNLRFFGGMGLGLGLALLWIIPAIEKHTMMFRAIWLCAFLGGIGRLVSVFAVGQPPVPMLVFTLVEVPLVPVLIYWQWKVSQSAQNTAREQV